MFVDRYFINPKDVSLVISLGNRGSKGCQVIMNNGVRFNSKIPMTQMVSMLGLTEVNG